MSWPSTILRDAGVEVEVLLSFTSVISGSLVPAFLCRAEDRLEAWIGSATIEARAQKTH